VLAILVYQMKIEITSRAFVACRSLGCVLVVKCSDNFSVNCVWSFTRDNGHLIGDDLGDPPEVGAEPA
jgi:hypothetical protein